MRSGRKANLRLGALVFAACTVRVVASDAAIPRGRLSPSVRDRSWPRLPLAFEPNVGQAPAGVQFVVHVGQAVALLSSDQVLIALPAPSDSEPRLGRAVQMNLLGAKRVPGVANDMLAGRANYLIGSEASSWHTGVPTYSSVSFPEAWPGVDLVFHGEAGELEYDFLVHPGASPEVIRIALDQTPAAVDERGDLHLGSGGPGLVVEKPKTYQDGRPVEAHFQVTGRELAFRVSEYDLRRPLIIDPVLSLSTYLGGNGIDYGQGIALDGSGSAYITGSTASTNFPTVNPIQPTRGTFDDAFVTKVNAAGTAIVFSTYLGGSGSDEAYGIAVDASGSASIVGETNSTDLPTASASQSAFGGGTSDAFVARLNAAGSALVYSTYLGGSTVDWGAAIALDHSGNAYVTGYTLSANFPTQTPFQGALAGGYDAFVTKLNANNSSLIYSTYLGGSGADQGGGIAVDGSGNAYVAGNTDSNNFPLASAFQPAHVGTYAAFVTKLNAAGSALVYSTYLGGSGTDFASAVAIDGSGAAYIVGDTTSTDFPTVAALQSVLAGANDVFVSKLNPAGSALVYSTYLGGAGDEFGNGVAVDGSGSAYVAGYTTSSNFPIANPVQAALSGTTDAFVAKLTPNGSALTYSTFLGGTGSDQANGIALDSSGAAFVVGYTTSTDFPTASPLQPAAGGNGDAFWARLSADGGLLDGGGLDAGLADGGAADAGSHADAGPADGGLNPDAGGADAGRSDAGGGDGGVAADASTPDGGGPEPGPGTYRVGCDCNDLGAGVGFVPAVLVALFLRRARAKTAGPPKRPRRGSNARPAV